MFWVLVQRCRAMLGGFQGDQIAKGCLASSRLYKAGPGQRLEVNSGSGSRECFLFESLGIGTILAPGKHPFSFRIRETLYAISLLAIYPWLLVCEVKLCCQRSLDQAGRLQLTAFSTPRMTGSPRNKQTSPSTSCETYVVFQEGI